MASYTELSLQEASQILELYGLPKALELVPLQLGISNSNYRVSCGHDHYLLKISNDKSREQLRAEQDVLIFLTALGATSLLRPFETKDDQFIYEWGKYFGVLYPYVEGEAPVISKESCFKLGRSLGELHALTYKTPIPASIRNYQDVAYDLEKIEAYANSPGCPKDFAEAFCNLIVPELEEYKSVEMPKGVIHGDFYYDNSLFKDDKLLVMLDFEQSGHGLFLLDVGIALSGCCLKGGAVNQNLVDSFLEGYETARPLHDGERPFIPFVIKLGLMAISLWRIKRFTEGELDKNRKDSYRELLDRALQYEKTR